MMSPKHLIMTKGQESDSRASQVFLTELIGSGLCLISNLYLGVISCYSCQAIEYQYVVIFYLFATKRQYLPSPEASEFLKDQFNLCYTSPTPLTR